jgi:hypothetical protein
MSKWGVAGIVVACLAAGFLIGVFVMPDRGGERVNREQVPPAVAPTLSGTLQPIIKEEARKRAQEIGDKLISRPSDHDIGIDPAAKPDSAGAPVVVEREAFEMTLPPGSVVKPENPKYGSERLVQTRVPGGGSLSIVLVDDKAKVADYADGALNGLKETIRNPESMINTALSWLNMEKVDGFRATIEGEPFGFEVGTRTGTDKGYVIIVEYPIEAEGKTNEVVQRMREALLTLKLKQ